LKKYYKITWCGNVFEHYILHQWFIVVDDYVIKTYLLHFSGKRITYDTISPIIFEKSLYENPYTWKLEEISETEFFIDVL